jgi:hypothetical protein
MPRGRSYRFRYLLGGARWERLAGRLLRRKRLRRPQRSRCVRRLHVRSMTESWAGSPRRRRRRRLGRWYLGRPRWVNRTSALLLMSDASGVRMIGDELAGPPTCTPSGQSSPIIEVGTKGTSRLRVTGCPLVWRRPRWRLPGVLTRTLPRSANALVAVSTPWPWTSGSLGGAVRRCLATQRVPWSRRLRPRASSDWVLPALIDLYMCWMAWQPPSSTTARPPFDRPRARLRCRRRPMYVTLPAIRRPEGRT